VTALGLVLAVTLAGAEPSMNVESYRDALDAIAARLDRGDTAGAAELASGLETARIEWEGEALLPDPALLAALARGRGTDVRPALDALRAALREAAGTATTPSVEDRRTLERLGRERLDARRGGPALPGMPEVELPWRERISKWISSAIRWVGRKLVALFRWLMRWWGPSEQRRASAEAVAGLANGVLVVVGTVAVLLVGLAAVALLRRRTRHAEPSVTTPLVSADADPTSRDESAWRARAEALAAEGRHREAIRAFYHALLVRCFSAGALQARRGTTNREYARMLDARVAWAPEFEELTLRFDVEWYGHESSTAIAFRDFSGRTDALIERVGRAEAAA
jgi:hypothetical protein